MDTSPLLARRVISLKERLQKALAMLLATAALVGGAWYLSGATLDSDVRLLAALIGTSVLGLGLTLYFAFRKHEVGRSKQDNEAIRQRIADDRAGSSWVGRIGLGVRRFIYGIVVLSGILIAVSGFGLFGVQAFAYLRTGAWHSISVLAALRPYAAWLQDPQSWLGLHAIASQFLGLLPASLALIVCGWMIAGLGSGLRDKAKRKGP